MSQSVTKTVGQAFTTQEIAEMKMVSGFIDESDELRAWESDGSWYSSFSGSDDLEVWGCASLADALEDAKIRYQEWHTNATN